MKKSIKRTLAAFIAAATMAVGMGSLSVSAGNQDSWYLQAPAGAPTSTYQFSDSGTVTGLVNGSDYGITYVRTYFYDGGNTNGVKAKCDITNHSLKLYPNQYAYIKSNQSSSTCLFKNNWWVLSGGTGYVGYTIQTVDYSGTAFQIRGYAY